MLCRSKVIPLVVSQILAALSLCPKEAAGQVGISDSGHYFQFRGKPRMVLADSGTQCVLQNLNLDYRSWVDTAMSEGHAGVHVWAFVAPRQKLDGSVVESRWGYVYPGITPWMRKADGKSAFDGGPQWDLQSFDEGTDPDKHYWPRLRDLCTRLKQKDGMLGITVFFGWPKDSSDFLYHPFASVNGGPAADRQDITHIESPGTEIHAQAWSDDWPARRKTQWLWEHFALKLIETSTSCGNVWFDFRDEWSYDNDTNLEEHFRTFFQSRGQIWGDRSEKASFRVTNPQVPAFGATPAVKTEGEPYGHDAVRKEAWSRALSGVHYLLHNDSREPGIMAFDPTTAAAKKIAPAQDLGRKYVGHAARFFNSEVHSLDTLMPASLVEGDAKCLATKGLEYVVLFPAGESSVKVDLSAVSESLVARFYDPREGTFGESSTHPAGGTVTFASPSAQLDWVLHLVSPKDSDNDGLLDVDELAQKTDPNNPDSDGDTLSDGDEVHNKGSDPLDPTDPLKKDAGTADSGAAPDSHLPGSEVAEAGLGEASAMGPDVGASADGISPGPDSGAEAQAAPPSDGSCACTGVGRGVSEEGCAVGGLVLLGLLSRLRRRTAACSS